LSQNTLPKKAFNLHAKQLEVFNDTTRFKIVCAGRRFGKSIIAVEELIRFALTNPGTESFAYCKDNSIVERIYRKPLYRQLKSIGILEGVHYTYWKAKKTFEFHFKDENNVLNDSTITLVSCQKFSRGLKMDFVVLDEYDYLNIPDLWEEEIEPTLIGVDGQLEGKALFISTPNGTAGELKKMFDRGNDPEYPEYKSWHFKTLDNPLIKIQQVEKKRKQMHPRKFKQEYEAEFVDIDRKIVYSFNDKLHVHNVPIHPDRDICIGCDFNVGYMCWVAFQIVPKSYLSSIQLPDGYTFQDEIVFYIKEFKYQDWNVDYQIEVVKDWLKEIDYQGSLNFYGDASGKSRNTSQKIDEYSGSFLTDWLNIDNAFPNSYRFTDNKNPLQRNRANCLNTKALNANKEIGIVVNSDLKETIKDFESVQWDNTGFRIDKRQERIGIGHLFDAASYPVAYEYDINIIEPFVQ
jgi:hypothetical protein